MPDYAQFDNDTRFSGPHKGGDVIGRVIRACLSLGVVAVFAPVSEHGFQNGIESYNGKWQEKVWARTEHASLSALQRQSARYVLAHRQRRRARIGNAPPRRKFPPKWQYDADEKARGGRIVFIRRTNDQGIAEVLGHKYVTDAHWPTAWCAAKSTYRARRPAAIACAEVSAHQSVTRFRTATK